MMNRRNTQIYQMLFESKNYSQIGKAFGITRERVRQIAEEYHWGNVRFPRPEGYVSVTEYAQIVGISNGAVRDRIDHGMPHVRLGDRIYIQARIRLICITCGVEIQKGRVYCPACFLLSRRQALWRAVNRRFCAIKGTKLPPNLARRSYPKRKYALVR